MMSVSTEVKIKPAKFSRKFREVSIQKIIETREDWEIFLSKEGLAVVDVYCSWAGPCVSMLNVLKRLKAEINDDRLRFASISSEIIEEFHIFKEHCEPIWLIYGNGVALRLFQGLNIPKLEGAIKMEFKNEIKCIEEGNAKRKKISLVEELNIRNQAQSEAMQFQVDVLKGFSKEKEDKLIEILKPYSLLLIQPFLLNTGVTTEIRDRLKSNFIIRHERIIGLEEKDSRRIFSISIPFKPIKSTNKNSGQLQFNVNFPRRKEKKIDTEFGRESHIPPTKLRTNLLLSKMSKIEFPKELLGDCILMLLEVKNYDDTFDLKKSYADSRLWEEVGPVDFEQALHSFPTSMHSIYGKNGLISGIWTPRTNDEKRQTMISFFPQFVTELYIRPSPSSRQYFLIIYKGEYMGNINLKLKSFEKNAADIYMKKRLILPRHLARKILKMHCFDDEIKEAIENEAYVLSVNLENETLCKMLTSLNPLYQSDITSPNEGRELSALLFKELGIDITFCPAE